MALETNQQFAINWGKHLVFNRFNSFINIVNR